ncbi:hypothetical protein [Kibdelosporangium aridum]|uniref:hypothetical protein n=1 Tax=Kibdelosporangium aridum TaxID=2030 RepID=UPI000527A904
MTSPTTAAVADLRDLPGEQDLVLAGRPLRSGVVLAETSRFADDVWRLEPAVLQRHVRSLALTFATVPQRYRLHAKQLCYAMLAGPLPAGEKRQSPVGIRGMLNDLRRFLRWLDARTPGPGQPPQPALTELTMQDLVDYNRHLLSLNNFGTRENARRAVRLLWRYRRGLTDPLTIDPQHIDSWVRQRRPLENATNRIPEPVLRSLFTWALRSRCSRVRRLSVSAWSCAESVRPPGLPITYPHVRCGEFIWGVVHQRVATMSLRTPRCFLTRLLS